MFKLKKINKKSFGYELVSGVISTASGIGFAAVTDGLMSLGLNWTAQCFKSRAGRLFVVGCGLPAMLVGSGISALAGQTITQACIDILADEYNTMADQILAASEEEEEDESEPEEEDRLDVDPENIICLDTAPIDLQNFIGEHVVAAESVPNIVDAIRDHIKNSRTSCISAASLMHYARFSHESIRDFVNKTGIDISEYGWQVDLNNRKTIPFTFVKGSQRLLTNSAHLKAELPIKLSNVGISDPLGIIISDSILHAGEIKVIKED